MPKPPSVLRAYRELAGYSSAQELAENAGVCRKSVQRLEGGDWPALPRTRNAIATELAVQDITALFPEEPDARA